MTDLVIRGMEMPKSCDVCPFVGTNDDLMSDDYRYLYCGFPYMGQYVTDYEATRHADCPLIPLPEGHGDLIDRDAFRADNGLNAKCEHCPTNTYECQRDMIHTKMEFCGMLDDAPVIVPAEGGTDDGN